MLIQVRSGLSRLFLFNSSYFRLAKVRLVCQFKTLGHVRTDYVRICNVSPG
jgi:hypothetical protein